MRKLQHRAGYQRAGFDLLALAAVFRQEWNNVASKTALTMAELDHAEGLGEQLLAAVVARSRVPRQLAEIAGQRLRCFTLFVKADDQVRRSLTFLRLATGDAELIAPSLYGGRKSRRRKQNRPAPIGWDRGGMYPGLLVATNEPRHLFAGAGAVYWTDDRSVLKAFTCTQ